MRSFKNWFTLGCLVLLFVLAMIIQNANPARVVDFRGEVLRVVESDSGTVTLFATSEQGGEMLFRIDGESRLSDIDGNEIGAEDLKEGELVDINFRKRLFDDEEIHTVKSLKVIAEKGFISK